MTESFDIIIVGSGAGGSAAAWRLTQTGLRVLLLEKGGDLPDDGSTFDPRLVTSGYFNSKEPWLERDGDTFMPEEHFNLGGKTRWYGAALLRYDATEFDADPDNGLLGWPVSHAEFLPWYERAEQLLGVHHFDDEPDLVRIGRDLAKDGWQRQTLGLGLIENVTDHPVEATHFDGYALPRGLKADAKYRLLADLPKQPNFTLQLNAQVTQLLPDATDPLRVAGVRCADGREFISTTVLLAAGAMHSPRLLEKYIAANRLATTLPAAEHVGRYFKRHILTAVIGFGWRIKTDRLCKTSLYVHPDFPHSSSQPLGGWADRETVRSIMPKWLPHWFCDLFALRAYGFFLQTEDASHPDNRVIAAAAAEASPPTLDYDLRRMPSLAQEHRNFVSAFMRSMLRAGLLPFKQSIALQGTAHCVGTLVMGDDPAQSVVDPLGKVHGMHNLYVVDGSVLPRVGRMNPALSIYAWSLRISENLAKSMVGSNA